MQSGQVLKQEDVQREYDSGDVVEPGAYVDVETGALVTIRETDELPDGARVVHYRRRFRRVDADSESVAA